MRVRLPPAVVPLTATVGFALATCSPSAPDPAASPIPPLRPASVTTPASPGSLVETVECARHDGDLGEQQTLVDGFQAADGSRWGRPVAAVAGPDRAAYITDDQAGAVYRRASPAR